MVKKWIINEFLKENIGKYVIGISALVLSCIVSLILPKMLGFITDCLEDLSKNREEIFWLAFWMLALSILLFCLKFMWRFFIMGRSRDLECFLRAKLFAHLQTLPMKFFNNRKTGDLMAYAINDLSAIRMSFAFGLVALIDGVIINLASLLIMVRTINPLLTLIAVGPVFFSLIFISRMRKEIRNKYTVVQEAFASLSDKIQENISGIRVVKAFVQEDSEVEKLVKESKHRMDVQMDYIKFSSLLQPMVQVCFGVSFTLVVIFGSSFVTKGIISLGDFIAFNSYLLMITGPVTNISRIVEVWQRSLASMKRLDEIFNIKSDIVDEGVLHAKDGFDGSIRIRNLSFSYPGSKNEALKDISIDLGAGKTLAVIGRTGSGKTTLVNLLLRLYKVERGHIYIDDTDINDIPLADLRENIGYVPQDNFLFSASIKENVSFFSSVYTVGQIEEAAKMASVYDNIVEFPEGFETVVGERGITLSGGQKQRVSISRALIKEPSILILDDSLSAVDTKTEEEILSNIKDILKGRTGIIIAHRISTIKHADEIIVLEDGRIAERGTHNELLELKGRYYKLYCTQLAESNLEAMEDEVV